VFTSRRRRRDSDDGFTLVEVLIAMGLASVILVATAPALLGMISSTLTVKLDSQAKNLAQERLEELRDLRFHVDRQNGPYLDLLDIYYTNATSSSPVKSLTVGGTTLTGQYVTSGATTAGEPAFPFYRTTTGAIAGFPGFTQVVDASRRSHGPHEVDVAWEAEGAEDLHPRHRHGGGDAAHPDRGASGRGRRDLHSC
jgi:prepilin-type N-terminal cleavage/methylation domain-containing protein